MQAIKNINKLKNIDKLINLKTKKHEKFFRKVGYGGPNDKVPSDPLKWALDQLNEVPELSWQGKIYGKGEIITGIGSMVIEKFRKKYKNNKTLYKTHKDILRHKTGQKF